MRLLTSAMAATFLLQGSAGATVFQDSTFKELLASADVIFQGVVGKREYAVDRYGDAWTLYSFDRVETIVGTDVGPTFSLRCIGGVNGDAVNHIAGTPVFEVGDEVLILLRASNDLCQIAHWSRGAFFVERNADTETVVTSDGRPIVSFGSDGPIVGQAREVWMHRTIHGGITVGETALPATSAITLVGPDGISNAQTADTSANDALPARLEDVKSELKSIASSIQKAWPSVTAATSAIGNGDSLHGEAGQAPEKL